MWVEGFVVIGIRHRVGYLSGVRVRSDRSGPVLSRLACLVASPALLFVTLAHADVGAGVLRGACWSPAVTQLGRVPAVTCRSGCRAIGRRGRPRVGAMASGYVNAGNLGIPIATYALGNAAGWRR